MFPYSDPHTQLELHRQHVAELMREADDHRLARTATAGRHRRFARWHRAPNRDRPARVTAAA